MPNSTSMGVGGWGGGGGGGNLECCLLQILLKYLKG